ncbi:MAG: hypothetical protein FWG92_01105 [Leptospirales bacterium]|nr:hypothetical protein [Leptospirales bacterium]
MRLLKVFYFCAATLIMACTGTQTIDTIEPVGRHSSVIFCGYDSGITDPKFDRQSFYKIYINKAEAGRTTIGLESQRKTFEKEISVNSHLLSVEKWVLNEKLGEYEKLNNVWQPKPSYCYFEVKKNNSTFINMEVKNGEAVFTFVFK